MIRVVVYSTEEVVRDGQRFIAHLIDRSGVLPVRFDGASANEVRAHAEAWLSAEREKRDRKASPRRRPTPEQPMKEEV